MREECASLGAGGPAAAGGQSDRRASTADSSAVSSNDNVDWFDPSTLCAPAPRLEELPVEILNNVVIHIERGTDLLNFVTAHPRFANLVSTRRIDERGDGVAVTLAKWYKRHKRSLPGPLLRRAMQAFADDDAVCTGVVTALLRLGVDPTEYSNGAVEYASQKNLVGTLAVILKDPRVDLRGNGSGPITWACASGYDRVVRLLLQHGVDPSTGSNCLVNACLNENVEIVRMLLEDGRIDMSADEGRALQTAVVEGNYEIVELLMSAEGIDPACKDNLAIRTASAKGYTDIVRRLLADPRVDPSLQHNCALRKAVRQGHVDIVKLLLEDPRVDPEVMDNMPLRDACENGLVDVVKLLLSGAK
ncbi:MAG: ankyrin repeat-containing domain protein [Olpidium bornovanus]|uniref:Ankyrin repeat-containing domain protein n=1 Tax=Olpidium bornovanus TaxID=278681 RepID=A0A8H8DJ03_9FUNG|nr:MAG: ankyrin repeat-containing domain protein [Olpidium bornovanus]